jgi:hypothetical protein
VPGTCATSTLVLAVLLLMSDDSLLALQPVQRCTGTGTSTTGSTSAGANWYTGIQAVSSTS